METRDCYIYIRALALMRRWQLSVQSYRLHLVFLYDNGVTHRHAFSATASVDPNSGPSIIQIFLAIMTKYFYIPLTNNSVCALFR